MKAGRHAAGRAESPESTAGDPRLRQLQLALGNDAFRAQMNQGRTDRSTMLTHLVDRLGVMQELQSREMKMLDRGAGYDWWREVARSTQGAMAHPDPNRWHEPARVYKEAGEALCKGDLSRGHQLLEKAMQAEDFVVERMSEVVDTKDLESDTRPDTGMLDGLVAAGQVEPCEPPSGLEIADRILATQIDEPMTSELRRTRVPWWAIEEEEDEEDGDGDGDEAGGE